MNGEVLTVILSVLGGFVCDGHGDGYCVVIVNVQCQGLKGTVRGSVQLGVLVKSRGTDCS